MNKFRKKITDYICKVFGPVANGKQGLLKLHTFLHWCIQHYSQKSSFQGRKEENQRKSAASGS
jgi:hypothetical protein